MHAPFTLNFSATGTNCALQCVETKIEKIKSISATRPRNFTSTATRCIDHFENRAGDMQRKLRQQLQAFCCSCTKSEILPGATEDFVKILWLCMQVYGTEQYRFKLRNKTTD